MILAPHIFGETVCSLTSGPIMKGLPGMLLHVIGDHRVSLNHLDAPVLRLPLVLVDNHDRPPSQLGVRCLSGELWRLQRPLLNNLRARLLLQVMRSAP